MMGLVTVLALVTFGACFGGGQRNVVGAFGMPVVSGNGQGGAFGVTDLDAQGEVKVVGVAA